MSDYTILRWIVLAPLCGAILNGLFLLNPKARKLSRIPVALFASLASGAAFALSVVAFAKLTSMPVAKRWLHDLVFPWIVSGKLHIDLAFRLDQLSAIMCLVVTGVSTLIHIYSFGYMHNDEDYPRFFTYLNLFLFAMLILVLGDSLLVMFVGWQGVGLVSYLLIGFWFHRSKDGIDNANAGMRSFIVNRIGDLGFLLGIFVLFWALAPHLSATKADAFTFVALEGAVKHLQMATVFGLPVLEVAGICLFVGAMGKSAQIPLYIWLPRAVSGPTPASALIHAVTMVTAGVYMIARMNFLYSAAPTASQLIAVTGAVTALLAATIAMFQNDIKKVLAYSTVSQLGFMFMAVGVGAYSVGIFHLMTHAFFKALLFMAAGSVIVGMHRERDIRKMGGLFKYMKVTGFTFFIGTLAIIGFPGFSGFFSQGELLWYGIATHHPVIWGMGAVAVVLTAFYMVRLFCLTFMGELRVTQSELAHMGGAPHETPPSMTIPLMVLAVLSLFGGFVGLSKPLAKMLNVKGGHFQQWLEPVFAKGWAFHAHGKVLMNAAHPHDPLMYQWSAMGAAIGGVVLGAGLALLIYARNARHSLEVETQFQSGEGGLLGAFYRLAYNKYYIDEIYHATVVKPVHSLAKGGLWPFDQVVIDGIVNVSARTTQRFARLLSWIQGGNVKIYLYGMAVGLASLLLWLMLNGASL